MNHRISLVATTLALSACAPVRVGPNGANPLGEGGRQLPQQSPRLQTPDQSEIRRVCRGQRVSGWVAIDYVADAQSCPNPPKNSGGHGTALLVNYTKLTVGRSLQVCADQPIPRNWEQIQTVPDDARCPREPTSTSTAPTVREIRRAR